MKKNDPKVLALSYGLSKILTKSSSTYFGCSRFIKRLLSLFKLLIFLFLFEFSKYAAIFVIIYIKENTAQARR